MMQLRPVIDMARCTKEEQEFIKHGFKLWRRPLLTLFFNAWFGLDKTETEIVSVIKNHRFKCDRKGGFLPGEQLTYSPEQIEWIKIHYRNNTTRMLAPLFNERFGTDKTWQQLRHFIHNRGIKSGRTGAFPAGHKPWNNGTKGQGLTGPNSGSFKTGQQPKNTMKVGEEVLRPDGYLWVKIEEPNKWRQKHYLEWEAANGSVPEGNVLWNIDNDPLNTSPENYELMPRSELVRLNQLKIRDYSLEEQPSIRLIAKVAMKRGELSKSKL